MHLILFILLSLTNSTQFPTCPFLTTSRSICENQINCKYYEWSNSACYYDCQNFSQSQCFLLYNCKWMNNLCQYKQCIDYTEQGSETCTSIPGCKWYWNKCRRAQCSELNANTQQQCSKSFCNWDELKLECTDKDCNEYEQGTCQSLMNCQYKDNKCIEIVKNIEIILRILILLVMIIQ